MPKTRVLIYGDSILLAGVQTLLQPTAGIELVTSAPDVVVFDVAKTTPQEITDLFDDLPSVRLIALDGATQSARVIQEQTHALLVAEDLADLILFTIQPRMLLVR
jgi:hypothetical protein